MDIHDKIKGKIRDVKDFPKEGIVFKDITPLLMEPQLYSEIAEKLSSYWIEHKVDAIAAVESRGFLFGMLMAHHLKVPFIPVRKIGKLPSTTVQYSYDLEYGKATVEIHDDAVKKGWNVLIHDDLLATGGTAVAAAELVKLLGGKVAGFSFLIALEFLQGEQLLSQYTNQVHRMITY